MVRYLHCADQNPRKIRKVNKLYRDKLDFKDIKFPVKVRNIPKIERRNSIDINVFGYEDKEKYPVYVSKKCCEDKHVDLLLIDEGDFKTKTLTYSCMITHYIVEENIFIVIVYKHLEQQKH